MEEQVAAVKSAKEHTLGFVSRPAVPPPVADPNDTVAALLEHKERRGFSSSLCVSAELPSTLHATQG